MSDKKNIVPEKRKKNAVEVAEEVLENVSGAGDPFEDVPRVPTQPIDPNLRENA